jgi:hypothetical protein
MIVTKVISLNIFQTEWFCMQINKVLSVNVFTSEGTYTKITKVPIVNVCTTGTYHKTVTKVISLNIFQTDWFCMTLTKVLSVNLHRAIQLLNVLLYETVCLVRALWKQLDTNVSLLWHGHICPWFQWSQLLSNFCDLSTLKQLVWIQKPSLKMEAAGSSHMLVPLLTLTLPQPRKR